MKAKNDFSWTCRICRISVSESPLIRFKLSSSSVDEHVEEIYDDVPPEFLQQNKGLSPPTNLASSNGLKSQPQDYTILHFEPRHGDAASATMTTAPLSPSSSAPPPVPPHAVDHSTYEPIESPPEQREKSTTSSHDLASGDSRCDLV